MSVDYRNSEGYPDPTPYEAFRRIEEDKKTKPVKAGYRPLVYICAPYSSDPKANTDKVIRFASHLVKSGYIPVCPHLMFPFLDDGNPEERDLALFMDIVLMGKCDAVFVLGKVVSSGMRSEILKANQRRQTIVYFDDDFKRRDNNA